jgi:hypothetical protein
MLGDISKSIGKDFLIAAFVPAALLVGMNALFVRWGLLPRAWFYDWNTFGANKPVAILVASFAAALVLATISSTMYRAFEGYLVNTIYYVGTAIVASAAAVPPGAMPAVFAVGASIALVGIAQLVACRWHRTHAAVLAATLPTEDWSRLYPRNPREIRETKFGNVLRAFEEYPAVMWNIEPITTWVRLTAVLPADVAGQIADAKTSVTLLLNTCMVAAVLAFETALLAGPNAGTKWLWAAFAWAVVAILAYGAAPAAAKRWGEYVRTAFDLYRLDLLVKMKVELPAGPFTFEKEREVWASVQQATYYTEYPPQRLKVVVTPTTPKRDPWG